MFRLSAVHLKVLCDLNSFKIKNDDMVFFGLRGCLPINEDDHSFANEHSLEVKSINHLNPRCTIIQWKPGDETFATFAGSTVPSRKYISKSLERAGAGANQLMTGYYADYRKGKHKWSSPTGHDAFRQTMGRPIRRTADDYDYDNDDRVEFTNPNDNLHAGWCQSINSESFASAGCQVIVGYPECVKRGNNPAAGAWKEFQENAYALQQKSFQYILLNGRDAYKIIRLEGRKVYSRLRYGSFGDKVEALQKILKEHKYYEGKIDKDFGRRTLNAVMEFQTNVFGPGEDDGIVGPTTAAALGYILPKLLIGTGK